MDPHSNDKFDVIAFTTLGVDGEQNPDTLKNSSRVKKNTFAWRL